VWRGGQRPKIEQYLADTPESEREELLSKLLELEVELRREQGESPSLDEYLVRFPKGVSLIQAALAFPAGSHPSSPTVSGSVTHDEPDPSNPTPPTESGPDLLAGTDVASRYEIVGIVGKGGMGVVYHGRHKRLDKHVAIKFLLPGQSSERFVREAKLLAKVDSPYVVGVHDFEILPDDRPMICMEWVDGSNLDRRIRSQDGPLDEKQALRWMRETCLGMATVAEQGITHRDLKPSNILIDRQGRARVADFGLARGPAILGDVSRTGDVVGTALYMAPEQAEDPRSADERADIYSFGATFYHALTGRPPFEGYTAFSILFKHKTEPLVPPIARNPQLSQRTSDLLERCLAKSPSERFQSFADVLKQLESRRAVSWDEMDDADVVSYVNMYEARRPIYLSAHGEPGLLETFQFPNGRRLLLLRGNIVDQTVDAIVSSDTDFLTMDDGVSLAIRNAGGPVIEEEARRYLKVSPGRAVVLPTRDLITEIMASCFYHADSLCLTNIAFPLLGTGAGGFSRETCLDTMFRFLTRTLLRGVTFVVEARIVLFEQ
jgi:O-acetyl-ADP-ribose deacetylase (regulator of RNase III)/tRNA A-37 threonylcarbamoyl transferase component Bud32